MDADQWQLGARWCGTGRTEFLVWAPHARRVDVRLLGPREQVVPFSPCGQGYYAAAVHDSAPGAHYFYRLDDRLERADPASRLQPSGVNGPSEIVDSAFDWHDADWPGLALADYVLYELHVGTFSPEGTLAGVIGQLDRLVELGITAIELMPLAQFPGSRNWGYDGVYPWAVQNSYGGPRELKRLVDACHRRGLGVVLDVVYNHLGPEGNYLSDFGPYFNAQHQTPWGPAINFEGPDSDAVRRYFLDSALMWVREFHVDGLRLDAIHAIVDRSARPFLTELSDRVHAAAAELGRPVQLIAENNRNDPRIFAAAQRGGLGLDAQWLDDFGRALQGRLTGERTGFYADFGWVADIAAAWRGGYVLDGRYSNYRRRKHGASSSAVPRERFFVYSQMHDQVGNRPQSDRLSTLVGLEQLKLAAATILLSPYQPLLFMGEEYGEPAPFHYFVSHLDPGLIERVRAGRRREFAAFHWQKEPADPQADSTFAASRLNHDLARSGWHAVLWNFYRELLRLRRELPAPACGSKSINQGAALGTAKTLSWESPPLLAAARADQNGQALVLFNFG
ncbi:MAG TPA: malto-oligosyltrehalose trehalohydrolase, partial [Pirellulales bacterium]|nr:malto-oligosyltrehalose trehalohydrolase [Pirellulales bacterium]